MGLRDVSEWGWPVWGHPPPSWRCLSWGWKKMSACMIGVGLGPGDGAKQRGQADGGGSMDARAPAYRPLPSLPLPPFLAFQPFPPPPRSAMRTSWGAALAPGASACSTAATWRGRGAAAPVPPPACTVAASASGACACTAPLPVCTAGRITPCTYGVMVHACNHLYCAVRVYITNCLTRVLLLMHVLPHPCTAADA